LAAPRTPVDPHFIEDSEDLSGETVIAIEGRGGPCLADALLGKGVQLQGADPGTHRLAQQVESAGHDSPRSPHLLDLSRRLQFDPVSPFTQHQALLFSAVMARWVTSSIGPTASFFSSSPRFS